MKPYIVNIEDSAQFKGCVLAYGHFNSIHPGHIRYLRHAKEQGEKLVVALLADEIQGNEKSYEFSQKERAESLAMIELIDGIVLLNNNNNNYLLDAIKNINPEILVLGKEFEGSTDSEIIYSINYLRNQGKKVQFHAGEIIYESTELLNSSEKDLINKRREQFKAACKRQKLNLDDLIKSMDSWNETRLIVLGDTIVDQYSACEAIGMSAEAPVVVVKELQNRNFLGGAAVVASHVRSLGAKCDFLSVVGQDSTADIVREELSKRNIEEHLFVDKSRPTTFKKRYVVGNQKLFRVSRLEDHNLDKEIESQIIQRLDQIAPFANGIILSDFVYGVVTEKILEKIYSVSKEYGILLFGDLQCSSQIGSITKFKNFSLLCPNEREARLALLDKDSGLELLSNKLIEETNCNRLIMKLGSNGFIAYDRSLNGNISSQSFPALSVNPVDVTGAGDSLLAIMATGLSSDQSIMATAALGCCMASLAVEMMGNTPINSTSLKVSIKQHLS
tara:strand:- start:1958 stop:3466 length:1509 start_codon:yes stop_codon:yes gene_type:complete